MDVHFLHHSSFLLIDKTELLSKMSDLPLLHSEQEVVKFDFLVFPPFDDGVMWSISSLAPSCGVRPQYRQVKLSLLNISNRSFDVEDFFIPLKLWGLCPFWKPFGLGIKPAALQAFVQFPKQLSYAVTLGKFFKCFISKYFGVLPKVLESSFSFSIKTLRGIFLRPDFLFITKYVT